MPPQLTGTVLLFANGAPPPKAVARAAAERCGAVLATDGAYQAAVALGLTPRWVVGDMDSLPPQLTLGKGTTVVLDDEQESSDFEKAVKFLLKSGCKEALVLGASGGRLDHELANLSVAAVYAAKMRLELHDASGTLELLAKDASFKAKKGEVFSLIAVDNPSWLSVSGAKYPVTREPLFFGSRGLSNVAKGGPVTVSVHSGKVWLFRAR